MHYAYIQAYRKLTMRYERLDNDQTQKLMGFMTRQEPIHCSKMTGNAVPFNTNHTMLCYMLIFFQKRLYQNAQKPKIISDISQAGQSSKPASLGSLKNVGPE